jgi:hypothetical protein
LVSNAGYTPLIFDPPPSVITYNACISFESLRGVKRFCYPSQGSSISCDRIRSPYLHTLVLANFPCVIHQQLTNVSSYARDITSIQSLRHVFIHSSSSLQTHLKKTKVKVSSQHDHIPNHPSAPNHRQQVSQSFEQHLE